MGKVVDGPFGDGTHEVDHATDVTGNACGRTTKTATMVVHVEFMNVTRPVAYILGASE